MATSFSLRTLITIYWSLFTGTLFVNKYVLSVLSFTFPTLFQGWQTMFGAVFMLVLSVFGKLDLNVSEINRSTIPALVPAMMMFVGSIYCGSVALSQLPVPIYLCLQNTILLPAAMVECINEKHKEDRKSLSVRICMIAVIIISCGALFISDSQIKTKSAYLWMLLYIALSGGSVICKAYTQEKVKLREFEQIFCNYIYSVIILGPSSFLLGDALAARRYPFLYFSKFYIGCVLSGMLGVLLSIAGVILRRNSSIPMEKHNTVARCLCAMMSYPFFNMNVTAPILFWVLVNLLAAILFYELPNLLKTSQRES